MELISTKPVGALGRIVIPSEIRRILNLQPGAKVGIYVDGNEIILRPLGGGRCPLCGRTESGTDT